MEEGLLDGDGVGIELGLGIEFGVGLAVGVGLDEDDGGCAIVGEGLLEAGDGLGLGEPVEPTDWSSCNWVQRLQRVSLKGDGY